jgi:N-acetylglucosaminyl-diphospho-decaprenol L-rhamnosyltransferase
MISLVVVNYRSARLAADAVRSARASTASPLHVVIVDNSCDAAEADALRSLADFLLVTPSNLGYAGAINAARPHCCGDIAILANPDVVFFDGAIDRLAAALADPAIAVAGPALYWDDGSRWILPPSDLPTLRGKVDEVLASRLKPWRASRSRRRLRRRLAFWALTQPKRVAAISGAVMALRLRDFDALRGFDERFALYFEETDFLRRITQAGRGILYVPSARCRHLYNQSAGADPARAAALYAASEAAYFSKWYGGRVYRALKALERVPPQPDFRRCAEPLELPAEGLLIEASPLPSFDQAAGSFSDSKSFLLPADVATAYRGDALYLRAVDPATARVVLACVRYRT